MSLRVVDVVEGTTVDGPGFRTSIYFAGCDHHCPGCHNPETWSFSAGEDIDIESLIEIIKKNDFNVTFSGGDPIYQYRTLTRLAEKIVLLGKTIWCYTGFHFEELIKRTELRPLLNLIEVVVDGPYVESLKNSDLLFCGSENQRLIDVRHSMDSSKVILWTPNF